MTLFLFITGDGESCDQNQNQGFAIDHDICSIVVQRNGQVSASNSNNVLVKITVTPKKDFLPFQLEIFNCFLPSPYSSFEQHQKITLARSAKTWSEAFVLAKDYCFSELAKYDSLVAEREKALLDAEF